MSWFDWAVKSSATQTDLPEIFPLPILQRDFVNIDVHNIYARILTDVLERTQGIPQDRQNLLWDNCLASEKQDGLVTLLAKAMVNKSELFLVYTGDSTKVLRKANDKEMAQIRADYGKMGESKVGVYITFKTFHKTDMIRFYSMLEYCTVGGLWKQSNMSSAIQIKVSDLRASVSLTDSADAKAQMVALAEGLAQGKSIGMDAKDAIVTATPDLTAITKAMEFIAQKQSFYLGLPASYLIGEMSGGMGDKGHFESKAVDRGLKAYYFSIIKPVVEGIFRVKTSFKAEDSEGLSTALETLKTMDATTDEYLSKENKTLVVNKAFGFDASERGDEPEETEPSPPTLGEPNGGRPPPPRG